MELEHCHHKCANTEFTTPNYNITTTSKSEYRIVAFGDKCQHMGHGRNIQSISKLRALQIVMEANLSDEEIMAVVLYTGPMVITTIHHHDGIAVPCSCALHTCDVQSSHASKRAYVSDVYVHPTRIRRSLPASLRHSF